ncbi:MAG: TonB-dependent receptor, partial [Fibrobacterota bacterium]|nr:TonB-dependent receptor [Fibrobacterota bacterium]
TTATTATAASAASDTLNPIDTLSVGWATREDSLRMAADSSVTQSPTPGGSSEGMVQVLAGTPPGHGSISGKVVSEMSGTVVAGARVILAGRERSVETDADGVFGFADLEPGSYSLLITHSGYAALTAESLDVAADKGTSRRLLLPDKAVQGEKVRITGRAGKASDAGLLFAQKNAPAVSDGISTEQIAKSPDGDASAAIKRVAGISIGGDGLVYVRGLGERYVNVQLNGLSLSSPNPDKRVIPLDIFPTRLIDNLVVSKTFTADQPAEFAGGSIQLRTKGIPDRRIMEVTASAGYDPGSTLGDMLVYQGGELDWLGLEDGTRDLPEGLPEGKFDFRSANLGSTPEARKARQKEILATLPNVWSPEESGVPFNQGYGLTLGNRIPLGEEWTAGYLLGATFGGKWETESEFVGSIKLDADKKASYSQRYDADVSTQSVLSGLLGTMAFQQEERNTYRLTVMANRSFENEVTRILGQREADYDSSLVLGLQNTRQTLLNGQLEGEHRFGENLGWKLGWMGALSSAERHQPDRRVSKYFVMRPEDDSYNPDFPYLAGITGGYQDRYWFESDESGSGGRLDLETPLPIPFLEEGSKFRTGGTLFSKGRGYKVHQFTFMPGNRSVTLGRRYEEVIVDYNGSNDSGYISNITDAEKNDYNVDAGEWAVYGQLDLVWSDWLRTVAGLRMNFAEVKGEARADKGDLSPVERGVAECNVAGKCSIPFGYDEAGLLPSLSVVTSPSERQNIRLSFSRTYSFPEYREMAPLLFFSYQENVEIVGNIALNPTSILNYDIRWEFYPSPDEVLAFSGFYKDFTEPVETRIRYGASNNRIDYANIPAAFLYGFEAESRFSFSRFHSLLSPFKGVGNYTWIQSEVEGSVKRAMQGQSPYLINAILFFEPSRGGTQMSLLYNRIGRRIAQVGVESFPDTYEEERETLEFAWSQKIVRGLKFKFTAKNLTDAEREESQGGLVINRSKPGRSFSLGANYAY